MGFWGFGVEGGEGFEVVDHLVVEVVDRGTEDLLEELEVKQEAGFVELSAGERDEHFVVVAVRVFALAAVVAEVVAGGETGFYGNFEHPLTRFLGGGGPLFLF